MAVLEGDPKKEGIFTMRLRMPAGAKVPPHWHPRPERVTILSGDVRVGFGDAWDDGALHAFHAGDFYVNPAMSHHFVFFAKDVLVLLLERFNLEALFLIDLRELRGGFFFFLDQCLYKVTTAENQRNGLEAGIIYADTKGMLIDRVAALREANIYEKQAYRHILGLPNIVKNGAEAESETPFLVVRTMHDGQTDVFATGVYLDTYRAAGNDLKFARRVVVCDSSRIDTLMALPL